MNETKRRAELLIDLVDEDDRVLGQTASRGQVPAPGYNFRVVHIFLFNRQGELLLQRIPERHPRHPSYWGSSVAGYVLTGESYEQAARRKLREELGIDVDLAQLKSVGKTWMNDKGSKKFIQVFACTYNKPLRPNPDDFLDLEFVPVSRLRQVDLTMHRALTPTFRHVLEFYLDQARVA